MAFTRNQSRRRRIRVAEGADIIVDRRPVTPSEGDRILRLLSDDGTDLLERCEQIADFMTRHIDGVGDLFDEDDGEPVAYPAEADDRAAFWLTFEPVHLFTMAASTVGGGLDVEGKSTPPTGSPNS